jgi:hypothetical protein
MRKPVFKPEWRDLPPELQAALSVAAVCDALFDSFDPGPLPKKEAANARPDPSVSMPSLSDRIQ